MATLGGEVVRARKREYGKVTLVLTRKSPLFKGLGGKGKALSVWMSHGDLVRALPSGFCAIASSENTPFTAVENRRAKIYGLQFHPEVVHTPEGLIRRTLPRFAVPHF
jgi:GMP synthase (glutamine-hydrolysing)